MKHQLKTTILMVLIFLTIQLFGVYIASTTMNFIIDSNGEQIIVYKDLNSGFERQQMGMWEGLAYMLFGILLGTALLIFLLRKKKTQIWKGWITIGIFFTMYITLSELIGSYFAIIVALLLTLKKIYKNDFITNTISEILIYPSFAILFSDFITIPIVFVLLGIISVYDYIAVFKSKHMVYMAKEITRNKLFMGLLIPQNINKESFVENSFFRSNNSVSVENKIKMNNVNKEKTSDETQNRKSIQKNNNDNLGVAILGGGDIVFPLLFNVAILKSFGLMASIFSSIIVALGLFIFFIYTKKGRFYPAIPPLTLSCFISYVLIFVLF